LDDRFGSKTEVSANINRISSSPFPSAHCKAKMREQIEALAQRAPSVANLVEHLAAVEFPMMQVRATVFNAGAGAVAYHDAVDVVGLIAFLHKPQLLAALPGRAAKRVRSVGLVKNSPDIWRSIGPRAR
jgi:phosphoribosylaminoimidazole (AIR) synthetase